MKGFKCLVIIVFIQFVFAWSQTSPASKTQETWGYDYNHRKYDRFMNFIKLPSLPGLPRVDLSFIPGFDCLTTPEWPGLKSFEFPCTVTPPSTFIPDNVHTLRPADIKVIGAMGDSLTAANGAGACLLPQLATEYRGKSFSHGGDKTFEKVPSLANILKKFNPNLRGYGIGTGRWDSSNAGLNVGYPGDVSADMSLQAERLVLKMQRDRNIDFNNDWKIVTLFIGANDLCDWCKNKALFHPQVYVDNVMKALKILQAKLPRTLVNVVGVINVPEVGKLRGPLCDAFHLLLCDCGMFLSNQELREFTQVTQEYQRLLESTIRSGVLDGKPDFTAVLQPFLHNTGVPLKQDGRPDFSYFAPDCFHFSSKGHASAAIGLWNNMMEPVGKKRTVWEPSGPLTCPSQANPYIYTNVNSIKGFQKKSNFMFKSSARNIYSTNSMHLIVAALLIFFITI